MTHNNCRIILSINDEISVFFRRYRWCCNGTTTKGGGGEVFQTKHILLCLSKQCKYFV